VTINDVYPWGRTLDEYRRMFALEEKELGLRIISCADGPASFNAEMTERSGRVVSCDPLYQFSGDEIRRRVSATSKRMTALVEENYARFMWDRIASPAELLRLRLAAMERFLEDYDAGRSAGRYLNGSLPELDFERDRFDLAVCSHFLFLYSEQFDAEFHRKALKEVLRVAGEARVFPLLDMEGKTSRHLKPVMDGLRGDGFVAELVRVPYEFQRGGNEMLRVRRVGG
jgi:hypothetical protein